MNMTQKDNVRKMRGAGESYAKIASALGLSENTVQSFCRRNNLTDGFVKNGEPTGKGAPFCLSCGVPIRQTPGYRARKYCSDRCRIAWWNKHPAEPGRKSTRSFACLACGKQFDAYGRRERKYCSQSCSARSKRSRPRAGSRRSSAIFWKLPPTGNGLKTASLRRLNSAKSSPRPRTGTGCRRTAFIAEKT